MGVFYSRDQVRRCWTILLGLCAIAMSLSTGNAVGADFGSPVGVWDQPCAGGVRRTEEISLQSAKLTETFHRQRDCAEPQMSLISEGRLEWPELLSEEGMPEGARAIDFHFEKVWAVFHSEVAVEFARRTSLCGMDDWKKDELVLITGLYCEFVPGQKPWRVPGPGDSRFGIFRVILGESGSGESESGDSGASLDSETGLPDQLQWGLMTQTRNGSRPDLRPLEWDSRTYLRRAPGRKESF